MSFKSSGYRSIGSPVTPDWAKKSDREPIIDKEEVAYGWIVKADPKDYGITSVMTTVAGEKIIDQSVLEPIKDIAIGKLIAFYNKIDTEYNRDIIKTNTTVKDVRVPARPKSPVLFYVLVDARAFDNIPEVGHYSLQLVTPGATLNSLVETYRFFFKDSGSTEGAHRARIAELLRANNVDIDAADETSIKRWIAALNGESLRGVPGASQNMPQESVTFQEGAKLYLPQMTMPEPPEPAFMINLDISDIEPTISKAIKNLEFYKEKIENFTSTTGGQVENLDLQYQIDLLNDFYPALTKHIAFNDMEVKYFQDDEINIFLNDSFQIIYIAINSAGEKLTLPKGISTFASVSPFNSLRTMALLANIKQIGAIGPTKTFRRNDEVLYSPQLPWEEFVEKYIFPPVTIVTVDPMKMFNEVLQNESMVQKMILRFQKNLKYQEDLDAENAALADPKIIGKAAEEESKKSNFSGDAILSNLSRISKKINKQGSLFTTEEAASGAKYVGGKVVEGAQYAYEGTKASGKRILDDTYKELLNRISISKLTNIAIECLRKLITCRQIVEGVLSKTLLLGYATFKIKLPKDAQYIADRALQIAQTGDYDLYGGAYKEASAQFEAQERYNTSQQTGYGSGAANQAEQFLTGGGETPPKIFLAVLELGLRRETSINFDRVLEEVCVDLTNLPIPSEFKIPTMRFPQLPTVDLQRAITAMLEAAIVELLISLIVQMVQMLLDEILWWCKPSDGGTPIDTDYGAADLLDSVAGGVGGENVTLVLADLFDSLGDIAPTTPDPLSNAMGNCTCEDGTVERLTKSECEAKPGCVWTRGDDPASIADMENELALTDLEIRNDIRKKCSLIKKLLNDLSVILTPAEISALFNDTSSLVVLDTILDVIQVRHAELYARMHTREQVSQFFVKLEKITDVGQILSQIMTISRGLGCTFESRCIREDLRRDNFEGADDVPDDGTRDRVIGLLDFDPDDLKSPNTFCEDRDSTIDRGLVPKDNASLIFLLEKVINVMYDGAYMAYDSEVVKIADSVSIPAEREKMVPRTVEMGSDISFDMFNFYKMQTEKFTIDMPDWLPNKTVINPEFQRLVSQGYIPPNGDYAGKYGPYTTEMIKLFGAVPIPWPPKPLEAVRVPEKYTMLAPDSKNGLREIDKIRVGMNAVGTSAPTMYYVLREPSRGQSFKPTTFALKFSLNPAANATDYRNTFILQVGDIPIDPSTIPVGAIPSGEVIPGISFGPLESAVYRSKIGGVTSLDPHAGAIISFLQSSKGGEGLTSAGGTPQVDVLFAFVDKVSLNGGQNPSLSTSLKDFVYKKMYGDLLMQISRGIGKETLGSPLFKKTRSDNTSYLKLIDWAPITPEEQRSCGFDPHILALDTVKKRTQEAYEQYITCSPFEDEIAPDGLGRSNLSALEAAGMTGCIMTTLRAYALEQLLRSMYPVSVFAGEEFITKLMVEYVIEETLRGIKRIGGSYYGAFLEQVEAIFALRMKEANPFGSIPDILAQSSEIGINWMYAAAAIAEFHGEVTGEEVSNEEIDSVDYTGETCDSEAAANVSTTTSKRSSKEQMVRSRVRFLVEEQLYSLIPKLQDLICVEGTVTFDENFLGRRLPLFDIQKEKGEMRLGTLHNTLRTMEEEEVQRQYDEYIREFQTWESNRVGQLLGMTANTVLDIAETLGVSAGCIAGAFGTTNVLDVVEAASDYGTEEEWTMKQIALGVIETQPGAKLLTGTTVSDLGICLRNLSGGSKSIEGVSGIAENIMSTLSDSPPPLEDFALGLDVGTTDDFGNRDIFTRGAFEGKFPLSNTNGALILEKYIKVRKKGYSPVAQTPDSDLPDAYNSPNADGVMTDGNPNDASDESTNAANPTVGGEQSSATIPTRGPVASFGGTTAGGLSIGQLLCPREAQNTSKRRITNFNEETDATPEENALVGPQTIVSLVPKIDPDYEQIYNLSEWADIFNQMSQGGLDVRFGDLYDSWSMGLRLVYVAPTNEFQEVQTTTPGGASQTLKIPTVIDGDSNPVQFLFNETLIDASKSYRQFERVEIERKSKISDYVFVDPTDHEDGIVTSTEKAQIDAAMAKLMTYSDAVNDGSGNNTTDALDSIGSIGAAAGSEGFQTNMFPTRDEMLSRQRLETQIDDRSIFEKVTMERALTLFPLSEIDIPINIDKNTSISNVLNAINIGVGQNNADFTELWQRRFMPRLIKKMKTSPGYKLLFDYCAPAHTLLSFSSIYANLLNEMSETFFDGTKNELKKLFEVLLNGGDYTFEGSEQKQRGGNRETMAYAQSNMGTDGTARKPALFDLAIQTPKLIFKGLAEFMDPVIAPAALIVKAGKAGLLLPKFMKKVDSEGQETEANYLLEVTVGPYDLPPPVGKFAIPIPEIMRPPGYVNPEPGLSDNPSENITFELPIFDFKDAITGQSMAPFLREKVFSLKNGSAQDKKTFYEFSLAIAQFDIITVISIVIKIYLEAANSGDKCADYMVQNNGIPIVPIPNLVYPGDRLDLPITAVAMATLPMDVLCGYGIGPPHSPLGWIYHAVNAAESLGFLDIESKARQRAEAGMENKKNATEKDPTRLCIDIDLIRSEEERRRK